MISDVEHLRLTLAEATDPKRKSQFGQFFTPAEIAHFMASLFVRRPDDDCRLLDAGAGIGSLSVAFLERWTDGGFDFKHVQLDAFEIDESLLPHLAQTLEDHSELIRAIIEEFAPRFAPGSTLVYVGDTGEKWGYYDSELLAELGIEMDSHGKMPDVVLYDTAKNWLFLVESVTSHGPIDGKRYAELTRLFADADPGLVFITAFPDNATMNRYRGEIAWETKVWIADSPSHMIHYDGQRFIGPYAES